MDQSPNILPFICCAPIRTSKTSRVKFPCANPGRVLEPLDTASFLLRRPRQPSQTIPLGQSRVIPRSNQISHFLGVRCNLKNKTFHINLHFFPLFANMHIWRTKFCIMPNTDFCRSGDKVIFSGLIVPSF